MQWFRLERQGTYSFGLTTQWLEQGLEVAVYQKDDLSTPLSVYRQEKQVGWCRPDSGVLCRFDKYFLPEPPYFIRVSNPAHRDWHGSFDLTVHRHQCTNAWDSCVLGPNRQPYAPHPPANKPVNPEDTLWFEISTDRAASGKAQDMEVYALNQPGRRLTLALRTGEAGEIQVEALEPGSTKKLAIRRKEVGPSKLFLWVTRGEISQTDFAAGWRTNLQWLTGIETPGAWPLEIVCGDETGSDWSGSDEIDMSVWVDGTLMFEPHFGDVDSEDHYSLEGLLGPVAYLDSVRVQLRENGDGSSPSEIVPIGPLAVDEYENLNLAIDLLPGDGDYEFRFNLARALNQ